MGLRIAISGTANMGKSTLVQDFLKEWPNYSTCKIDYRSLLGDISTHSKNTTPDLQLKILEAMLNEMRQWKKGDAVIMDRCPLDNIVYSYWAASKNPEAFNDKFFDIVEPLFKEAMTYLDMIILIPMTGKWDPEIVDDGTRETDPVYLKEIDSIFNQFKRISDQGVSCNIWEAGNVPGIIEIFGSRRKRIKMLKTFYLDSDGNLQGGNDPVEGQGLESVLKSELEAFKASSES